jgi:hypothetical protein
MVEDLNPKLGVIGSNLFLGTYAIARPYWLN